MSDLIPNQDILPELVLRDHISLILRLEHPFFGWFARLGQVSDQGCGVAPTKQVLEVFVVHALGVRWWLREQLWRRRSVLITHIIRFSKERDRPGWSFSLRRYCLLLSFMSLLVLQFYTFKLIVLFVDFSDHLLLIFKDEVDFAGNFGRIISRQRAFLVHFVSGVPITDLGQKRLRGRCFHRLLGLLHVAVLWRRPTYCAAQILHLLQTLV